MFLLQLRPVQDGDGSVTRDEPGEPTGGFMDQFFASLSLAAT